MSPPPLPSSHRGMVTAQLCMDPMLWHLLSPRTHWTPAHAARAPGPGPGSEHKLPWSSARLTQATHSTQPSCPSEPPCNDLCHCSSPDAVQPIRAVGHPECTARRDCPNLKPGRVHGLRPYALTADSCPMQPPLALPCPLGATLLEATAKDALPDPKHPCSIPPTSTPAPQTCSRLRRPSSVLRPALTSHASVHLPPLYLPGPDLWTSWPLSPHQAAPSSRE